MKEKVKIDDKVLYNVHLTCGTELICQMKIHSEQVIILIKPVEIMVDPGNGDFIRYWLYNSIENYTVVFAHNILRYGRANSSAIESYNNFMKEYEEIQKEDELESVILEKDKSVLH